MKKIEIQAKDINRNSWERNYKWPTNMEDAQLSSFLVS